MWACYRVRVTAAAADVECCRERVSAAATSGRAGGFVWQQQQQHVTVLADTCISSSSTKWACLRVRVVAAAASGRVSGYVYQLQEQVAVLAGSCSSSSKWACCESVYHYQQQQVGVLECPCIIISSSRWPCWRVRVTEAGGRAGESQYERQQQVGVFSCPCISSSKKWLRGAGPCSRIMWVCWRVRVAAAGGCTGRSL